MKIVRPYAEVWDDRNMENHIIRCAQLCYASEKIPDNKNTWLETKWKNGHKSIFRHGTHYFAIPIIVCTEYMKQFFKNNPYVGYYENDEWAFVSVNDQTYKENTWFHHLFRYSTTEHGLFSFIQDKNDAINITNIIRRTVFVQTQISTSRELNRTSPNNICEQSTRYCNFTQEKFGNQVSLCEPWWFNILYDYHKDKDIESIIAVYTNNVIKLKQKEEDDFISLGKHGYSIIEPKYEELLISYLRQCISSCDEYSILTSQGMAPQDARGILPLDTATKVVYTYRIEEWKHILDLRYYGTTGKPHPNAKEIANMIRFELNNSITHVHFPEAV